MNDKLLKLQKQLSRRITNAKGCIKNLAEEGDSQLKAYWQGRKEALEDALKLIDIILRG